MNEHCVNPYCRCRPCRCERPCTCGLVPVGHAVDEVWDAERQELRHTVTQTFRHDPRGGAEGSRGVATPGAGGHAGHAVGGSTGISTISEATLAVGEPGDLLDSSMDADARRAAVMRVYETTPASHDHGGGHASERTATHKGHTITIRTTYEALIDGEVLDAHMSVGDDGNVHYHGLPNYTTASAVDLMKQIIDSFPDDYPERSEAEVD